MKYKCLKQMIAICHFQIEIQTQYTFFKKSLLAGDKISIDKRCAPSIIRNSRVSILYVCIFSVKS